MFAGAAREVVFSNPQVVRRINNEFIPVALKAALVNNPPRGVEGALYAEIGRSKPAPQGICTANSAGKVLAWALSFDDDDSILSFLDHAAMRFRETPDAAKPVTAQRYLKFPSRQYDDVADTEQQLDIPARHAAGVRCPAHPELVEGTLVGRIVGRALDEAGHPVADTIRQEHYMEARLQIPVSVQEQLALAAKRAGDKRFSVPDDLARLLVGSAYLGQLDVDPSGKVPGSQNDRREWEFSAERVEIGESGAVRLRVEGRSEVAGGQNSARNARGDGRMWEHRVSLTWQGYVDMIDGRVTELAMLAEGDERLRWGNARFNLQNEADAEHLMAGHPIDLQCGVRYGVFAED